ncbi:MAG TPA: pyridoxal 5'-phosphate synthase glutaminase subunit PdxT [Acidobacteriota bacterium]|nr:pyridoxal 5'-phosphate synthase glutaminase subunit PdxT [Acidobacteriota bacterium]
MKIGVLALQGDFAEHVAVLKTLGVETSSVRLPDHLDGLDGVIIPGGESTTIGKLAEQYNLMDPLREFGRRKPIWGTCAGAILLSRDAHRAQPLLNLMDITVARNAFGSQIASFEINLYVPALTLVDACIQSYRAVFIRAPLIESVRGNARALATLPGGEIVAVQEGHWLATSFHPELTADYRFHRFFLALAAAVLSRPVRFQHSLQATR